MLLLSAGFLDRDADHLFAASGRRAGASALYLFGGMGLRFGMGSPAQVAAIMSEPRPVSDAWLAGKSGPEKRFSVEPFDPAISRASPARLLATGRG